MKKWKDRLPYLILTVIICILLSLYFYNIYIFDVSHKIIISKDTTYVTDIKLKNDGTVDYVYYLNKKFSRNMKTDNNLAALMIKLLGHNITQNGIINKTKLKILNIKKLPEDGTFVFLHNVYNDFYKHERKNLRSRMGLEEFRSFIKKQTKKYPKEWEKYCKQYQKYCKKLQTYDKQEEKDSKKLQEYRKKLEKCEEEWEKNFCKELKKYRKECKEFKKEWKKLYRIYKKGEISARQAMLRPWLAQEYPILKKWLDLNKKNLDLFVKAEKRGYYSPFDFFAIHEYGTKKIIKAIFSRSMMYLKKKKFKKSWENLKAILETSISLHKNGIFVEKFCGINFYKVSIEGMSILAKSDLSVKQAKFFLSKIRKLEKLSTSVKPMIELWRLSRLEKLMHFYKNGGNLFDNTSISPILDKLGIPIYEFYKSDKLANASTKVAFNWNIALKRINRHCNKILQIYKSQNSKYRKKQWNDFILDIVKNKPSVIAAKYFLSMKYRSKQLGDAIIIRKFLDFNKILDTQRALLMYTRLVEIEIAIAGYKAQYQKYPDNLKNLVPQYFATNKDIPKDIFSNKPLKYRKKIDGGFILYSVGPNLIDDMGIKIKEWGNEDWYYLTIYKNGSQQNDPLYTGDIVIERNK